MKAPTIFVSYSHRDEGWKNQLLSHLEAVSERVSSVTAWDDTHIPLGSEWSSHLMIALERADVAILLISADFLSSRFIREVEVPTLLDREAHGKVRLWPLMVRPSAWQTIPWLANRAVYPRNAPSLASLPPADVESELSAILDEMLKPPSSASIGKDVRASHRPEDGLHLFVEGPDEARFELLDVPRTTTIADLTNSVAAEYPPEVFRGRPRVVDHMDSGRSSTRLKPDTTLHDNNVRDGDTLHVSIEATAGCLPFDTPVRLPSGLTAALGDIAPGDLVASPSPDAPEGVARVREVIVAHTRRLVKINDLIRITPDHGVFCVSSGGTWIPAGQLRLGDYLLDGDRRVVVVRSLAFEDDENFEVGSLMLEPPNEGFVANGVVVFGTQRTRENALMKAPGRAGAAGGFVGRT